MKRKAGMQRGHSRCADFCNGRYVIASACVVDNVKDGQLFVFKIIVIIIIKNQDS